MIEISLAETRYQSLETRKGRILLVENDYYSSQITKMVLEREGFQIISVTNGSTAKNLFNASFDLILTDIDISSYKDIKSIREIKDSNPEVKCIAMTSNIDEVQPISMPLLLKPFSSKKLIEDVENILYS
ncbi:MAG: response regulator transcription factor [Candidatus Heimdallarchaeota archaeon]|nr:response regulator transcription factor [Candidatus Heimdallarchaeota archaeon]MCK4769539.1 response regulator transcription factor [Candidatus Heimdallarchaeota archaeon]